MLSIRLCKTSQSLNYFVWKNYTGFSNVPRCTSFHRTTKGFLSCILTKSLKYSEAKIRGCRVKEQKLPRSYLQYISQHSKQNFYYTLKSITIYIIRIGKGYDTKTKNFLAYYSIPYQWQVRGSTSTLYCTRFFQLLYFSSEQKLPTKYFSTLLDTCSHYLNI